MQYGVWNMAHFEGRRVKAWQVFESVLREVVSLIFKYVDCDDFLKYFVKVSDFVSVTDGQLIFNFEKGSG